MNVKRSQAGPCRLDIQVQADAEETGPMFSEMLNRYRSKGRVPGFRPGKAPESVVLRRYRSKIEEDTRDRLIADLYPRALRECGLEPVAILAVNDVQFSTEDGLRFTLRVDVTPDFTLPRYTGLPLKDETETVADEAVDRHIAEMRRMMAHFVEAPETHAVERGDAACIDYSGTLDGQPLGELVADCGGLAEANDFWAQADEPEFIPQLALGLIGMRVGESRDIDVTFPEKFHVAAVSEKTACYKVTVKAVRRRELPTLDEEFYKRFGVDSEAELRSRVRSDLERRATQTEDARRRDTLARHLLGSATFDLPQSVVAEETRMELNRMLGDITRQGGSREVIAEHREALVQSARRTSEERVRLNYVLLRIAQEEQIGVGEEEVTARLSAMAARYQMTYEQLRERLEAQRGVERLRSDMRAEKAMDYVLSVANIT